jgi:tRNA G18 (ribose-2'-O)-methylase SpoU
VQTRARTDADVAAAFPISTSGASAYTTMKEEEETTNNPFEGIACFGEGTFFSTPNTGLAKGRGGVAERPIVAVENFTERAQSIMHTRLPSTSGPNGRIRLVVGHENWGVRRSLLHSCDASRESLTVNAAVHLPVADVVVYVPQYGTISSLNVVTSLGIALFYCYVDENCPCCRNVYAASDRNEDGTKAAVSLAGTNPAGEREALREKIAAYQDYFKRALPTPSSAAVDTANSLGGGGLLAAAASPSSPVGSVNTTPRIDKRPIHPVFYKQEMSSMQRQQRHYRQMLLQYSLGVPPALGGDREDAEGSRAADAACPTPTSFGLSVLYENEFDQRNFGGLIRNANAFLVDHIFYVGRRKYNVVGAVGSYHYTPPIYLGPLPSCEARGDAPAVKSDMDSDNATHERGEDEAQEPETAGNDWSASLQGHVERAYQEMGGADSPREWWLLDCGHRFLYETRRAPEEQETVVHDSVKGECRSSSGAAPAKAFASSAESLRLYKTLVRDGRVHSLCEPESALRTALSNGGVVLVVPQEGKLPHAELMKLCTGVLTILPDGSHYREVSNMVSAETPEEQATTTGHRGLPSQVASGIALQRLSAVLHPRLAAI